MPPSFINEGVAQPLAEGLWLKGFRGYDYHELSAEYSRRGDLPRLRAFTDSALFLSRRRESKSFATAHASFCGWLIESYGLPNYLRIFAKARGGRSGDGLRTIATIEAECGAIFDELESRWRLALSDVRSPRAEQVVARW